MDEFSLLCQHSARLVCCCRRAPRGTPGPRLDAMDAWFDAAVDRSLRAGTATAAAARVAPKPNADGPSTTCLSPSACRRALRTACAGLMVSVVVSGGLPLSSATMAVGRRKAGVCCRARLADPQGSARMHTCPLHSRYCRTAHPVQQPCAGIANRRMRTPIGCHFVVPIRLTLFR